MEGPRRTNKRIGESEGPNEKRNVLFKKPLSRLFLCFYKIALPFTFSSKNIFSIVPSRDSDSLVQPLYPQSRPHSTPYTPVKKP